MDFVAMALRSCCTYIILLSLPFLLFQLYMAIAVRAETQRGPFSKTIFRRAKTSLFPPVLYMHAHFAQR